MPPPRERLWIARSKDREESTAPQSGSCSDPESAATSYRVAQLWRPTAHAYYDTCIRQSATNQGLLGS